MLIRRGRNTSHVRRAVLLLTILVLHLARLPQVQADEWKWLGSLQMFDARTGWAIVTEGGGGAGARGAIGSVVRTTDGGLSWKDVTPQPPPGRQFRQGVMNVQALTRTDAWLLADLVPLGWDGRQRGQSAIYRTADGGRTWGYVPLSEGTGWVMDFLNHRDGWSVAEEPSRDPDRAAPVRYGVRRTADGGRTWTTIGHVEVSGSPTRIVFLNVATGWIVGSSPAGIDLLVTRDGGRTWRRPDLPVPPEAGRLRWGARAPDLLTSRGGILSVLLDSSRGSVVLFYVSQDSGRTWASSAPLTLPDVPSRSGGIILGYWGSTFVDLNHGWVTDGEAVYATRDGGRHWTKIRPRLPFDRSFTGLEFVSPTTGWAVSMLMEKPFLWRTVDGGCSWTDVPYVVVRP